MLATVQKVSSASIIVNGELHTSINRGVVIFVCIEASDSCKEIIKMKDKIYTFKILEEDSNIMSASLQKLEEDIMIVSQYTLAAITTKGTRASFHKSAKPQDAKLLYDGFVREFRKEKNMVVEGVFGEHMDINLVNTGPITFNFKV